MKLHRAMLALVALLPIFLIAPAAGAEFRLAIINVKGMVCDS